MCLNDFEYKNMTREHIPMVSIIPKILGESNVFVMYSKTKTSFPTCEKIIDKIKKYSDGTDSGHSVCCSGHSTYEFLQGIFDNVSLLTNLDFFSVFPSISYLFLNTFGHLGTPSTSQEGELRQSVPDNQSVKG